MVKYHFDSLNGKTALGGVIGWISETKKDHNLTDKAAIDFLHQRWPTSNCFMHAWGKLVWSQRLLRWHLVHVRKWSIIHPPQRPQLRKMKKWNLWAAEKSTLIRPLWFHYYDYFRRWQNVRIATSRTRRRKGGEHGGQMPISIIRLFDT